MTTSLALGLFSAAAVDRLRTDDVSEFRDRLVTEGAGDLRKL